MPSGHPIGVREAIENALGFGGFAIVFGWSAVTISAHRRRLVPRLGKRDLKRAAARGLGRCALLCLAACSLQAAVLRLLWVDFPSLLPGAFALQYGWLVYGNLFLAVCSAPEQPRGMDAVPPEDLRDRYGVW